MAARSAVGVQAAQLQNTDPPINSATARMAIDVESADLTEPERVADSPSVLIANPVKLQQHIRGGDQSDCEKRRAPSKSCDETACQHGADGPADAISYGYEAGAQAAPMRQQIGHDARKATAT